MLFSISHHLNKLKHIKSLKYLSKSSFNVCLVIFTSFMELDTLSEKVKVYIIAKQNLKLIVRMDTKLRQKKLFTDLLSAVQHLQNSQ